MCGIVGVAGWVGNREKNIFSNLLGWDVVRGPHATGLVSVKSKTNEIHILKRAMHAYDFMDLKVYDPSIADSKVIIGHNRFQTVGANSNRNAHPFVFDNAVGVHNGTIQYMDRKVLKNHDKFDTDSEAIYANISEFGVKETLKDLKGAWSLVWWDRMEHKLNFLRNKERPMYWTLSESKRELYWASECPMLMAVLARHNVKHGPVYGTAEDIMLSFTIPDDNSAIEAPERTEVKGAAPFVFQGGQRGLGAWSNDEDWYGQGDTYSSRHRTETALPVSGTEARRSLTDMRSTGPGSSSQSPPSLGKLSEKPNEGASSVTAHKPEAGSMLELVEAVNRKLGEDKDELPFTPEPVLGTTPDNLVHLRDKIKERGPTSRIVRVHKGCWVGKEEFDRMSKNGCVYCERQVEFADVIQKLEAPTWLARDAFMCEECGSDPDVLLYIKESLNIEIPKRERS